MDFPVLVSGLSMTRLPGRTFLSYRLIHLATCRCQRYSVQGISFPAAVASRLLTGSKAGRCMLTVHICCLERRPEDHAYLILCTFFSVSRRILVSIHSCVAHMGTWKV